jgi:membrane protease YdiL (CAAX protease family)
MNEGLANGASMESTSRATPRLKQELATYLLLTFGLSSIFYYILGSAHSLSLNGGIYVLMLMWCPGTSALLTRLIFQKNVRGEGWAWGNSKYELLAYALPILYAVVAYGAVWLAGLGRPDISHFGHGGKHPTPLLSSAVQFVLLGTVYSTLSALGEELGWRGFLVPKLAEGWSFTTTALVSGIIWASWHVPLIIAADYNGGTGAPYSIACFAVMVIGISFPLAWIRLRSKSVWPAALLHASHNLYIQGFFDTVTVDTGHTKYWIGEFGAALAITAAITGFIFWKLRGRLVAVGA